MPTASATVLLVAPTDAIAERALRELTSAGLRVNRVSSFAVARERLNSRPDLLVSEIRLREHNGLHLALRAQSQGIPAIVVGHEHPVTRREAAEVGAAFVPDQCDSGCFSDVLKAAGVQGNERGGRTHAA